MCTRQSLSCQIPLTLPMTEMGVVGSLCHSDGQYHYCPDRGSLLAGLPLPPVIHATLPSNRLQEGRVIIIGDVHGCPDELQDLLAKYALLTLLCAACAQCAHSCIPLKPRPAAAWCCRTADHRLTCARPAGASTGKALTRWCLWAIW